MFAGALLLSLCTGFGMGFQAPTNAALSKCVGNAQATLVNFAVGLFVLAVLTAILGSGNVLGFVQQPVWQWMGGLYGAFFVIVVTYASPVLGIALTLTAIMLGQLVCGMVVDSFGLLGATQLSITPARAAGIGVVAIGVMAIYRGRVRGSRTQNDAQSTLSPSEKGGQLALMLCLSTLAGIAIALQAPTNAALAAGIGSLEASCVSFAGGTVVMLAYALIVNRGKLNSLTGVAPWKLTGGLYGAFGVLFTAIVTPVLGVGLTMAASMLGQMSSGVIIDAAGLLQAKRIPLERLRIAGIALIALGIIVVCIGR